MEPRTTRFRARGAAAAIHDRQGDEGAPARAGVLAVILCVLSCETAASAKTGGGSLSRALAVISERCSAQALYRLWNGPYPW